jgi:signal transduction histidine kinase
LTKTETGVLAEVRPEKPFAIRRENKDLLEVYSTFPDITGRPAVLMRVDFRRDITRQGRFSVRMARLSFLAIGLTLLLVMMLLLQRIVVGPISALTLHAKAIRKSNDLSRPAPVHSRDEIGVLANEFDRLMREIDDLNKRLGEQSYRAGMAEMVSGVLHNIRNDLSPMIVNLDLLRQDLRALPVERIETAGRELAAGNAPETRRKDLSDFLDLAVRRMAGHARDMNERLDAIAACVSHIETVLADQERFGQANRAVEYAHLGPLLVDAVGEVARELDNGATFAISPDIEALPPFVVRRLYLRRILVNLLRNALESIRRASAADGKVAVTARTESLNGQDVVHVRIDDNGEGVAAENLTRIFEREFPRRGESRSGVGLHWCSNAVTSMGGRIYAESAGTGACFHLLIPIDPLASRAQSGRNEALGHG